MSGQCCCIHPQNPSDEPDCWAVSSPEQCPVSRDCAYRSGLPTVRCVAARMANDQLVTPFLDRPEMLSAVSDTYRSMFDVRTMLTTSALGRRVLDYGKSVSDETARIVAADPELGSRVFEVLMRALSFARAMERERLSPGSSPYERRFTEEDYAFGARVAEEVRARTDDPALIAALDDLRGQAARFIGMTPAEALGILDDGTTAA